MPNKALHGDAASRARERTRWLCRQLMDKYNYSNDIEFLRNRAYPLMKGAAFARSHNQKFYPAKFSIDKRIMKKE
ncbi:MAG: glycosyl hydrolase family 95 catalytic domain-containing protein [Pirellulales bacterium]